MNNMILKINTSDSKSIQLAISFDGQEDSLDVSADHQQSELILESVEELLARHNKTIKDLKTIAVVKGPGPFSALRIGVTTANALAWGLDIPVVGIKDDEIVPLDELLQEGGFEGQVEPEYGAEPNITKSKK